MAAALRWVGRVLRGLGLALWFGALSLIIGGVLAYLAYNAQHYDRVYRGVSVLGIPLGGQTPAEALDILRVELRPERLPEVALQIGEERRYLPLADLGGAIDLSQTVADAYGLGRGSPLLADTITRLRLLWQGYDLIPTVTLDPAATALGLRPLERAESDPARRARLLVSGLEAHVAPATVGRTLDLEGTVAALDEALIVALGVSGWQDKPRALTLARGSAAGGDALVLPPLVAPVRFDQQAPPLAEVADASAEVATLIGSPLTLTWTPAQNHAAQEWLVDQATLASWLTLDVDPANPGLTRVALDETAIGAFARSLQPQIERPAVDGRFGYDADAAQLTVLSGEQLGYQLDVPEAARRIANQALSGERRVELPVRLLSPAVPAEALNALLPLELLGEGATQFVGSAAARQENIVTAARLFEGVTVAPGETFSFLGVLGPVNRATAYEDSWVIFGNRTELGPGGGVCQVATTCFRAAFWAGLPIIERHPHAYRVSWYEPPVGLDASVFEPYVDLQFINDYADPLLIQVLIDERAQTLAFRFYGRGDGRAVTMTGPDTSNPRPAPAPVFEEDDTLQPGQRVQVESAHDGLDVTIVRQTAWPDGRRETYDLTTRYAAWPARYLLGPGAAAPTD